MEKRKIRSGVLRSTLSVVVCIGLYGCGGGSDGTEAESSVPTPTPVNQGDFWLTAVQPELSEQGDYQAIIDLSRNFQGLSADVHSQVPYISDVFVANSGGGVCLSAFTIPGEKQTFTVDLDDSKSLGTCQFDITVMRNGITEEQKLIADVTNTPWEKIPAISQALSLTLNNEEASVTIDLATAPQTKDFIANGYALSATEFEVFGDVTVTPEGNTLMVTASNNVGPNRIVYQLVKDGESKTGIIDVTVSDAAIEAPQVIKNNFVASTVATNTPRLVNLLSGIIKHGTYPNEELEIISLKAPDGGVVSYFDNNPKSLAFNFSSGQVGEYTVNYTVSDHHGGYASGSVIFNTGLLTSPNTEQARNPGRMVDRIVLNDVGKRLIVNRPQLLVEMEDIYPGLGTEGIMIEIAGETWGYLTKDIAVAYCTFQGKKLITKAAFEQLITEYTNYDDPFAMVAITDTLGWPARPTLLPDETQEQYYYYACDTSEPDIPCARDKNPTSEGVVTINGMSNKVMSSDHAIPLCVFDPIAPFPAPQSK